MKPLVPKLTTFTEDILQLVNHWKDNSKRTPEQLKNWPGDKIFQYAGNDQPHALCLLKADGFDGLPVFKNHTNQQMMEAAANRELLAFTADDVIRIALFFNLDDIKTIVLLVKAQWERFLVSRINRNNIDWVNKTGVAEEFFPAFMDNEKAMQKLSDTLQPLDASFGTTVKLGITPELYGSLVNHILVSRTFYFAIESIEIASFVESQNQLLALLKSENSAYNDLYHARNKQWIDLLKAAENAHLRLEDQRMQNAEDERNWMAVFGDAWYELSKTDMEYQSLKRKVEMKKQNPQMTAEQVEAAVLTLMEAELEQLQNMETAITISQLFSKMDDNTNPDTQVNKEVFERYKKVLRAIWLKTHPDKVNDKGFTPEQLELLQKFYRQATEMSATDRLINPLTLERLEVLLHEVDELYANMGLNINLNTTVKGSTLKEKVEWLENQIKILENELTQLKNELFSLVNDATLKQKAESMKDPETIELVKNQMIGKKNLLTEELAGLKKDLDHLFK